MFFGNIVPFFCGLAGIAAAPQWFLQQYFIARCVAAFGCPLLRFAAAGYSLCALFLLTLCSKTERKMLKFICFGSGSSGNCYYINMDGYGVLIDLGIGLRSFKRDMRNYGLSFGEIKAILVTHDHTDHVKSVGALSGEFHLPVYASDLVHQGMQRNYFMSKKIGAALRHAVVPGEEFALGPFGVLPFAVPHDSMDNCGYLITAGDTIFCLATDMGCVTDDIRAAVARAHYLVVEANYDAAMLAGGPYPAFLKRRITGGRGHMDNADTARLLAGHLSPAARRVWLCHLSEENNHPELARKTVETALLEAGKMGPGQPLQLEVLKRKVPSPLYELA